jgi:homoserine kinase
MCSAWGHWRCSCSPQGDGDVVTATAVPGQPGVVRIDAIAGDGGRLSLDAAKNCVGIAAAEVLALLEAALGSPVGCGVALQLQKVAHD